VQASACFLLSLTLKIEAIYPSETSGCLRTTQKTVLFTIICHCYAKFHINIFNDFRLSWPFAFNVHYGRKSLHHMNVGNIADVSKLYAASIFRDTIGLMFVYGVRSNRPTRVDNSGQGKLLTRTLAPSAPTRFDPGYRGGMCSHPHGAETQSTTDKRTHFRMGALRRDITQNEYYMRFCCSVNGIAKMHFFTQRRDMKQVNKVHFRVPKCRF
jgi:hypothetical protein